MGASPVKPVGNGGAPACYAGKCSTRAGVRP